MNIVKGNRGLFNPRVHSRVCQLAMDGLNNKQIAMALGVSVSCFVVWRKKYPELENALGKIRDALAKDIIGESLYKLASGYNEEEMTEEWIEENEITGEKIKKKKTLRYNAPSLGAIKTLITKHCPNEYDVNGENGKIEIRITQRDRALTLEERLKVLEKDRAQGSEVIEVVNAPDDSEDYDI